tara:strand:+ start:4930 stop:5295 length:366 start_codon:yes stop_codon:yes gene_type:complete
MLSHTDAFNTIKLNLEYNNINFLVLGGIIFVFKKFKNYTRHELSIQIIRNEHSIHIFTDKYEYSYYNSDNIYDLELIDRIINDVNVINSLTKKNKKKNKIILDQMDFNEAFCIKKSPIYNL